MMTRSSILRILSVGVGLGLAGAVSRADSLTVTPGVYFVRTGDTVTVSVQVDCPDMAFLTIDIGYDSSRLALVSGSPATNPARVDTTNGIVETFVASSGKLTFQADNLGAASVFAGTDWVFRFQLRGLARGVVPLNVTVGQAQTPAATTPDPIVISDMRRVTVYDLTGLPPDPTNDAHATVSVVGDGVSQYRYSLDGGAYSAATDVATPMTIAGLAEGEHTLDVVVGDAGGNWQPQSSATHYQWTVDFNVPDNPTLASATPATNVPFNANATSGVALTWTPETGADSHSYSWVVDTAEATDAPAVVSGTQPPANLAAGLFSAGDGPYYLHLRTNSAADGSGTWSATVHFGPWLLDTTPPVAAFAARPPDPDNSIFNVEFQVSPGGEPTDAVVEYKYRVDGGAWSDPVAVATATLLNGLEPSQEHTFEIIGRDAAGNWQSAATPTAYSWYIDITPPSFGVLTTDPSPGTAFGIADVPKVTILTRTPATDAESDVVGYAWALTKDDPNPDPGYKIQGTELPAEFDLDSGDGDYYLGVRAFDAAGNFNATVFTTGPWTVDTVAPAAPTLTSVTSPINAANVTAVMLAGAGEPGGVLHYTFSDAVGRTAVSGVAPINAAGEFSVADLDLEELADGNVTLDLFVRDAAGNDSQVVSQVIAKDTVAPDAPTISTFTDPVNASNMKAVLLAGTAEAGATVYYTITSSAGSAVASGDLPVDAAGEYRAADIDVTSLGDGTLTATIFVRDGAGNDGPITTATSSKDSVPPVMTVTWLDPQTFKVSFSEEVVGAGTASSYTFDPSPGGVAVIEQQGVYRVTTGWHIAGKTYVVNAPGVTDLAGNAVAESVSVETPVYFRITAHAGASIDLVLGVSGTASAGFDPLLDRTADLESSVYLLAADEPDPDHQRLRQDFRQIPEQTPVRWRLIVVSERTDAVDLSWDPALVSSAAGTMSLVLQRLENEQPVGAPIDMKNAATATVTAGEYEIALGEPSKTFLSLLPGWNLLGIPVMTPQSVDAVFRTAGGDSIPVGPLWVWRGEAYQALAPDDTLNPEIGVWVFATRQSAGDTASISGLAADGVMDLSPGWNLVSPVADIPAPTRQAIVGGFWRWDASGALYRLVPEGAMLHAGKGYWVYVTSPGVRLDLGP